MTAMSVSRVVYPTGPVPKPLKGNLFSAATVEQADSHLPTDGLWESLNCLSASIITWPCAPGGGAASNSTKTFSSPTWVDGLRVTGYVGVVCKGHQPEDQQQRLEMAFDSMKSRLVAQALMAQRFVASSGHWAAPVDLTPAAGAVAPLVGVALLEDYAAQFYAGYPTIHVPRVIGGLLTQNGTVSYEGNSLYTGQGSPVASDGGYSVANQSPAGVAAPVGEKWIYATGGVWIGETIARVTNSAFNQSTNEKTILAEGSWLAAVDCLAAGVRVKVA